MVFPADRAKKKAEFRSSGSHQRETMVTISEPDPGPSEEPEDTSLDREIRRRTFGRCPFLEDLKGIISVQNKLSKKNTYSSAYI